MVAYGDARQWDAEWLHETVGLLNQRCTELVGLSDELAGAAKTDRWHGKAAGEATANLDGIQHGIEDLVSEIAAMRTAMGQAADSVTGLRHGIADAESLAGRYYLRIEDNGELTDTTAFTFPSEDARKEWEQDRNRVKAELVERIKEIIRRADDIDNDLTSVMAKCIDPGGVGNRGQDGLTAAASAGAAAGTLSMLEPPTGSNPSTNAAWWATMGEGGKQWILANHPEWIGNRDGVPAHYRDLANRARIGGERTRLQAERDAKAAELKAYKDQPHPFDQRESRLMTELAGIDAKLKALTDVEAMLARPNRHLLALDTTGERAKAAVAVGDVDTADHVSVFTPGMNSTVNDRMKGYDQDMEELRDNATKELERNGRGGETVAAVTWLNYEPPNFDLNPEDAASDSKAKEGAARLSSFLNGIDASRTNDPHLTAIGHSYGSLTTGIALRDNVTGVDDVAVFGSPGLGVSDTSHLQAPQGHIYNMSADGDTVANTADITKMLIPGIDGWYGRDPAEMPGMRQLSTHDYTAPDGRHFVQATGHSEYLRAGDNKYTTSEWNLANIVAGTGITH